MRASLTYASGKILDPKTVTVQKENKPSSSVATVYVKETKISMRRYTRQNRKTTPVSDGKKNLLKQASDARRMLL